MSRGVGRQQQDSDCQPFGDHLWESGKESEKDGKPLSFFKERGVRTLILPRSSSEDQKEKKGR